VRTLWLCATAALYASAMHAESLTVVMAFDGPRSERSIAEMKHEAESILSGAEWKLDWKSREEAAGASFDNVVLVRFRGKCVFEPVGFLYDERGTLAYTWSTDGAVQPFSEIGCDQVTRVMRSAMSGQDFAHGDVLLGRALGRVLAHELFHVLTGSGAHGRAGVAKPGFSGVQLIAPDLKFTPADLERIYTLP
jgi:hypothetical protein